MVKFLMFRLLKNAPASQKIDSRFYTCPQVKLSPRFLSSPPLGGGGGELLMPQAAVFEYLSPAERGRGAPNNPEK